MSKKLTRKCEICGCQEKTLVFKQSFEVIEGLDCLYEYDVVACNSCGFLFADNICSQNVLNEYYKVNSKYEQIKKISAEKETQYAQRLQCMIQGCKTVNKNLFDMQFVDIGCATGEFLSYLKAMGHEHLTGVDPSIRCIDLLNEMQIDSYQGTISDLPNQRFDLICLNAVLEHIEELNISIEHLKNHLQNDGLIFISVPDVMGFIDLKKIPFQEFSLEHINYFTAKTLTLLMRKHGFVAVEIQENRNQFFSELQMIFAYRGTYNCLKESSYDLMGVKRMKEYVALSTQYENINNKKIQELIGFQQPIVIWGVGAHTLRQLKNGALSKCNISCFVDSNPHYQHKYCRGLEIISPKDLMGNEKIFISSYYAQNEIKRAITEEYRLDNEIITLY